MTPLKSPYPWFGGKGAVAAVIWQRLGADVRCFVDPFLGSAAILLSRPNYNPDKHIEIVNDLDGMVVNFWRAVQHDPDQVAYHADWPRFENDLHARHAWLVQRKADLVGRLEGDPDYHDAKAAGWWAWGQSLLMGRGWCSGRGPWHVVDGRLVRQARRDSSHATDDSGITRSIFDIKATSAYGVGIISQRAFQSASNGVRLPRGKALLPYVLRLSDRFRRVRVVCGDWSRVLVPAVVEGINPSLSNPQTTAIILDPPYAAHDREANVYAHDDATIAYRVRDWAVEHGRNPKIRIALCSYDGHYDMPDDWAAYRWQANGGLGNRAGGRGRVNKAREVIWFSPSCIKPSSRPTQKSLFDLDDAD